MPIADGSSGKPESPEPHWDLLGCDFSSRPGKHKHIVVACGSHHAGVVRVHELLQFASLDRFGLWLARPRPWVGAFDFPFGLPRELVLAMGWPLDWEPCMRHYCGLSRQDIRSQFAAFCAARPVGSKFAHRNTDRPAGSSPSMKWINPPVAYMMHAGVPLLLDAGVFFPGLTRSEPLLPELPGPPQRIALEAYPAMLAREVIGRQSYKSDEPARQDAARRQAREQIVLAVEGARNRLGLAVEVASDIRESLLTDASGDCLDAVLCLLQAAWAAQQGWPLFGLPPQMDPLEGWIATAPATAPPA